MITRNPYGISQYAIKPGRLPEPLKPVITMDPQSAIDRCLSCTKKECYGTCVPEDSAKYTGERMDIKRRKMRDEQIRDMIMGGKMSGLEICRALGISKNTFFSAKQRLRDRGEIRQPKGE